MKNIFNFILKNKEFVLILFFVLSTFLSTKAIELKIDASADSLILDGDKDLELTRRVNSTYKSKDFLVLTYTPLKNTLLSKESLRDISQLSKDILELKYINSVTSILNVPLLQSPIIPIGSLVDGAPTIKDKGLVLDSNDTNLIKKEFLTSDLYSNSLVSSDFKTTAILLYIENGSNINQKEFSEKGIKDIREIISNNTNAKIFIGGMPIIINDVISYIKNDLLIYGIGLFIILGLTLMTLFKKVIWFSIPLLVSIVSVSITSGIFTIFNLEVTVLSSNFIALQLILTLSLVIHLIIRYIEIEGKYKKSNQKSIILNTVLSKLSPSVFATSTTIVGFGSLVLSEILPVQNLGIMMSIALIVSFISTFTLFPSILLFFKKQEVESKPKTMYPIINFINVYKKTIYIISFLILLLSSYGSSKLIVENSFINYFKKDTEIYQGMKVIDDQLGGTTPLDLLIKFKNEDSKLLKVEEEIDELDEFDEFEESSIDCSIITNDNKVDCNNQKIEKELYWFTDEKLKTIKSVHNYLNNLKEIGKVQSFQTLLNVGKTLNENEELDSITLGILYQKIPEEYKEVVTDPYLNMDENEIRFNMRIKDSLPDLRRDDLIKKINKEVGEILNDGDSHELTGVMILYNNMLQSLFDSQIKSLSIVLSLVFLMFFITFKSFKLAAIGLVTNIIPISLIFGIMGLLSIPLDMMAITVASIAIGIGVDDTIHYIHRFQEEFKKDLSSIKAVERSHNSIGFAMYYTTLVIILGFSILLFSNLMPTIYFSILTIVVMFSILLSALFLLPRMLIDFKI